MPSQRILTLDLETCATDAHTERVMSEKWDATTFTPKNNAKDPLVVVVMYMCSRRPLGIGGRDRAMLPRVGAARSLGTMCDQRGRFTTCGATTPAAPARVTRNTCPLGSRAASHDT